MPSKASKVDDISEEPPTSINPYEVLGVDEKATADQIKSAYRKQALKHHPDKVPSTEKESANAKFQEVAFAYAILSDDRRRKRYDTTGNTSESLDLDDDDFNWTEYFREQYASAISFEILEKTKREYQGSEEEKRHLLNAYEAYKGDINRMYEEIMLSNPLDDEDRFCAIIDKAIKDGEVKPMKKYTEESQSRKGRRMAKARREAEEAEEALKELQQKKKKAGSGKKGGKKGGDEADLAALIQQRQKSRATNFFDDLEAKYGGSKGSDKGSKRGASEPPEEAFTEMGARAKKGKEERKPAKRVKPTKVG